MKLDGIDPQYLSGLILQPHAIHCHFVARDYNACTCGAHEINRAKLEYGRALCASVALNLAVLEGAT